MPDKQIDAIRDDVTATAQLCASAARELAQMAHDLLPKVSREDPCQAGGPGGCREGRRGQIGPKVRPGQARSALTPL